MERRIYTEIIQTHFKNYRQMVFLMGPRQVGKTTIGRALLKHYPDSVYLNWDNVQDQKMILDGGKEIAKQAKLDRQKKQKTLIVFDELHKFGAWKNFLKGFFDVYEERVHLLVTGSCRLDVYKKGGDSLMGRYFTYKMHPLSVGELLRLKIREDFPRPPKRISREKMDRLWRYGGYPEPYVKKTMAFYRRWRELRHHLLFREDLRELSNIQELGQVELLSQLLSLQVGQLTTYTGLANKVRVSVDTVRRWIETLKAFYFCFEVRPWSKNISRSLLKEPKYYLWDWSVIENTGAKFENFIASHLLKAVNYYNDLGLEKYELYFLRDKEQREVDFLVVKDGAPWVIIEAKISASAALSDSLFYYQKQLDIPYAFQVSLEMPYLNKDCFQERGPVKVSAFTLLSQLV